MKAAELRALLDEAGVRPWRGRSQNFLLDDGIVEAMTAAAGPLAGAAVVEVGPGVGILTGRLLDLGARVVAVELDRRLCAFLRRRFGGRGLELLEGDVLALSNDELRRAFSPPPAEYRVVANLPYSITSRILQKFLLEEPLPRSMTVMIQREVADRILAGPGDMSSLAVLVQTLARPRRVVDAPAGAFFPPPKVRSAVIHMEILTETGRRSFFGEVSQERYFSLVRAAFAEPRKQLANSLKRLIQDGNGLNEALISAKISPSSRPEELTPADWLALAELLR